MTAAVAWRGELSPGQTRDPGGNLRLGGIDAARLAAMYATPLLVVDLDVVDAAIDRLRDAAPPSELEVSYAAKAFLTIAFARHLAARGIGLDICSLGELLTAERAGYPARLLTLHGAGKTAEELRAAVDGRVGTIVVDGIQELRTLSKIASGETPLNVVLRLNTGIEAHTHEFVRTGGDDSKFGIHERDEHHAIDLLAGGGALRFAGLHAHVGSQIYQSEAFFANADALLDAAERFAARGLVTERMIVGGGYGVQCDPNAREESLDTATTVAAIVENVKRGARLRRLPVPCVGIEPGRAIVALAGTTVYTVLAIKRQERRTFVIVDGGIAENPRPALYGAYHHIVAIASVPGDLEEVTVCGRSCENDELAIARLPARIAGGDLLAMCATGAYTYSMAGNYNRFPRPAVVGVRDGTQRLLARRERVDDVLRNDED